MAPLSNTTLPLSAGHDAHSAEPSDPPPLGGPRRHFASEVILWALRWYLAFPISYRDLASMLSDRGVVVDYTTLSRWIQAA
jgi:hypothetical protein